MKRIIVPGQKLDQVLSPLEEDILKLLWGKEKMRVKEIHTILKKRRKVALCSVAVLLDRLHSKKIVGRDMEKSRGGVRYVYFSNGDQKDFEKNAMETAVNKLIDQFGNSAVSYFNERFNKP